MNSLKFPRTFSPAVTVGEEETAPIDLAPLGGDVRLYDEFPLGYHWFWDGLQWRVHTHYFVRQYVENRWRSCLVERDAHGLVDNVYYHYDKVPHPSHSVPMPRKKIPVPAGICRAYARKSECPVDWLSDLFKDACNGELSQNTASETPTMSRLQAALVNLFLGGTPNVPDSETQRLVDESMAGLKKESMTFLSAFRWCVKNWRSLREAPLFTHVGNLLCIAIVTGFAPESWTDLHLNSVRIYRLTALSKFTDVFSLLDGVVNALNYFVESVVASWEAGNLSPFLYETSMSRTLDERYEELQLLTPSITNGTYRTGGGNWSIAMQKYSDAIMMYEVAVKTADGGTFQRKIFQDRLVNLKKWQFEVAMSRRSGELVPQPFGLVYHGRPGCGKSSLMTMSFKMAAASLNLAYEPGMVAHMTPDDKYDSGVKNSTIFVAFNDVANRPLKYDPSLGIAKLLSMCDNVPYVATKAEADQKGNVLPEIVMVCGSTNKRDLNLNLISVDSDSLRRRFWIADIRVKDKYINGMGGIDRLKFQADPDFRMVGGQRVNAPYTISLCVAMAGDHQPATEMHPITGESKVLANMEIDEYLFWLEHVFTAHRKAQLQHVANANEVAFKVCKTCARISCTCRPSPILEMEEEWDEETVLTEETVPEPTPAQESYPSPPVDEFEAMFEHSFPSMRPLEEDVASLLPKAMETEHELVRDPLAIQRSPALNSPSEQHQSYPRTTRVLEQFLPGLVRERLGFLPWIYSFGRWFLGSDIMVSTATAVCLNHLNTADYMQWWYWLPDDVWDWDIVKKLAPVLQDVNLRRALVTSTRRSHIAITAVFPLLFFQFWRLALISFLVYLFYSTKTIFLTRSTYVYLSSQRNAVSLVAEDRRKKYGVWVQTLLVSIATLGMGVLVWEAYQWYIEGDNDCPKTTPVPPFDTPSGLVLQIPDPAPSATPDVLQKPSSLVSVLSVEKPPPEPDPVKSKWHFGLLNTPVPKPPVAPCVENSEEIPRKASKWKFGMLAAQEKEAARQQEEIKRDPGEAKQSLLAMTEEELRKRNEIKNAWQQRIVKQQVGIKNPNMTYAQLEKLVTSNLTMVFVKRNGEWEKFTNVLFIQTNIALVPAHCAPTCVERWKLMDSLGVSTAKEVVVTPHDFVQLKNTDMCFFHTSYRDKKNLIPYFDHNPVVVRGRFLYKDYDTGEVTPGGMHVHGAVDTTDYGARVLTWKWPRPTFKGSCGGAYLSEGPNPSILGVHYAGVMEDLNMGRSFCPTQTDIANYVAALHQRPHTCLSASMPETWNVPINGHPQFQAIETEPEGALSDQVAWCMKNLGEKPKDPVVTSEEEKQGADFKGIRSVQAFYKSSVKPTVFAEDISVLYPDKQFGPPRFGRSMWARSAMYTFDSSPGLPSNHLEWAVKDYMTAFQEISPYLKENLRPLTWDEVLNGIDGVRFIDSMNFGTSMGLGFSGGKKSWVQTYYDDLGIERRQFAEEVWEQVEFAIAQFKRGERVPWIFNATPKDEPTPVTKEKVRLFMVAEIACTLLVRKYYTPICRVLQMTTGVSECAVGVNATSADWEEIARHLERFDNVFDGDHSKYDLRKSAQISGASYRIFLEIAALGDYTDEDLFMMQMICADLLRPLVNYNGFVYMLFGSTPSGISVTVILNGVDNGLMNRCAFFAIYPKSEVGDFRKYVSHINYGDDFINSVSWWRRGFNFLSMQAYLAEYGLVITPGVKDAEGKKFVADRSQLVFLQRQSNKLPELPFRVGALHENSIFKSLLAVLGSDYMSPEEAAVTNVDGALREWVYHGREKYELRRSQMDAILTKHNIRHLSQCIDVPYLQMLIALRGDDVQLA